MASCTVKPYIQTSDGQMIESKLFNDLLHYSGNDWKFAKQYYGIATDPQFRNDFGSQLSYDANGEVTFKSLKSVLNLDIASEKLLKTLNSDLGAGIYDYRQAIDKLQAFNRNSEYNDQYLATIKETSDGKYELSIVEKNAASEAALNKVISNRSLWDRLIYHLNSNGVNVEFLEEGPSRYSTENAEQAANGLYSLIQLAHGEHQTSDLAEEAGHFAVGALGNNPLIQRLMENLTPEVSKALLGEEYESKYMGVYGRREVAGALVGKALNNEIDQKSILSNLLDRIVNLVKKTFAKITGNEILAAKNEAQQIAQEIAQGFMSSTFQGNIENALEQTETLYSAELSRNVKAFKAAANQILNMAKQLNAIDSQLTSRMEDILKEMEAEFSISNQISDRANVFTDARSLQGVVKCMQLVLDMLVEEIPGKLNSINFSNSLTFGENQATYGQQLREVHIFLQNAAGLTEQLRNSLSGSKEFEQIVTFGDESADPTTGRTQQGTSLSVLEARLTSQLAKLDGALFAKEKEYFSRFLKEIYGKDYIETSNMRLFQQKTLGTRVGNPLTPSDTNKVSLNDLLDKLDYDISIFDAFIGSMSNSSDVISQIIDKAVKAFNAMADRAVDRDQDALKILKAKFEFLQKSGVIGKEGTETFFERSRETGKLTGNLRTDRNWGDWESEWIEFKQEAIRQFHMQHALTMTLDGKAITRSEYRNLSDEDQRRVKITSSDLDGRSQIFKDDQWENFFKPKRIRWTHDHSVWSDEHEMWIPNDSYRDYSYDQWADRFTTMYKLTGRTSKGREYVRFLSQEEYDKLDESEQENCTREEVSIRSLMKEFMAIKETLDAKVGFQMPFYRAPQVKGTFTNKRKNRLNYDYDNMSARRLRALGKTLRREIADDFCEDSQDTDFGSTHTYNTIDEDVFGNELLFEKEKLNRLPLFFINKLKDTSELSTDIFHSLLAFSSMANSYFASSQVVHAAEVGSEILKRRKVGKGNNPALGKDMTDQLIVTDFRNDGGLAYRRYSKYMEKQIYGIGLRKIMVTKRICLTKISSLLSKLGSTIYLSGNVAGGLVNIGTGFNEMFKEACTGQFYTVRNFANAHKQYWGSAAATWANIGELAKQDKVSLMIRYFDILGDQRSKQRSWYTSKNKFFGNFMFGESLMLPYSAGEHYMQSITYLSLLDAIKVYDKNGRQVKLFDAYKVIDIGDGVKTLALSSGEEGSRDLVAMTDMYNWLDDIIHGNKSFQEYYDKLGNFTDEERGILLQLEEFNHGRPVEPQHMTPEQLQNLLIEALAEKRMFFKSEDGMQQYEALKATMDKVQNAVHLSDVDFSDQEVEMLKKHKVYPVEGTTNEFDDESIEDVLSAIQNEIESITWSEADEINFMDKAKEVSDRLHGIYNRMDKTWMHQHIFTNMLLVMKGYALGMMQRRFGTAKHSIALDQDVEGSVRTFLKMLSYTFTDRRGFGLTLASSFSMFLPKTKQDRVMEQMKAQGFNEFQYYNMRRNALDLLMIGVLALLKVLSAKKKGDDDDDDEDLLLGWVYYFSYRLHREQVAFNLPYPFLDEASNLTEIVPPGISVLKDLYELTEGAVATTLIYDYQDGMTSNDPGAKYFYLQNKKGLYEKGDRKWVRKLSKMAPYYKSRYVLFNPYEAAESYDYGRRVKVK